MATGAAIGAGVLGAGASIYSANKQSSAMDRATSAQENMQRQAMERIAPYAEAGEEALSDLGRLARGEQDITDQGAYQQIMSEGQRAIESSAAAGGMLRSGPTLAQLPKASLQARDQVLGELRNLATMGANAASGQASQLNQIGQTQAQGIMGQGQVAAQMPGNVVSSGLGAASGAMNLYNASQGSLSGGMQARQPTSVAGNVPHGSM